MNASKPTTPVRYYRVPDWAKRECGAKMAREIVRETFAACKADGVDFETAVMTAEQQLEEAADYLAMQRIERDASLRFNFPDSFR